MFSKPQSKKGNANFLSLSLAYLSFEACESIISAKNLDHRMGGEILSLSRSRDPQAPQKLRRRHLTNRGHRKYGNELETLNCFCLCAFPRDPPVLKILRRVNFGTGSIFGTGAAKRYREGSEMLVFLGRRGRKTLQKVKNYGGSKILRIRAPYYF